MDSRIEKYVFQPWKRLLRDRAFLVCVLVLVVSAVALETGTAKLGVYLRKQPLALRAPFDDLDTSKLYPYEVLRKYEIKNDEVISELGTEEYIQWYLRDTSETGGDSMEELLLFITYYTGDPGQVPHVPEVCYTGGGSSILSMRDMTIRVKGVGVTDDKIPVRVLNISMPGSTGVNDNTTVIYFFGVNGGFANNRSVLRAKLNNFTEKYVYFSKVEFIFEKTDSKNIEKMLLTVEKLSARLVPILVAEHWPEWPVVEH